MPRIIIGKSAGRNVGIDLNKLIRTRLLVQANSGGGKSWLLRRLAEQLFGKIQVIIIDPEGEFATLREKFGYVLVGKGGDTPADPRSAEMLAHKLLELRASAVCDLYEMKESERHRWLKLFLDALINSPKKLWHQLIVIVDEAHMFCPEGKAGESEASAAVMSLCSRGRKRGFCAVLATQSLATLNKRASRHLLNRLIGPTFEDVDLVRAIELLSISASEKREFSRHLRTMDPGMFYALGRAVSKERILVKVGEVKTTHPDIGSGKSSLEPPPPPAKIRGLLPKLADLPQQAEEKAKTEAEFRREIRSLKAELRARPAEMKEVQVADPKAIERAIEQRDRQWAAAWKGAKKQYDALVRSLGDFRKRMQQTLRTVGPDRQFPAAPKNPKPAKETAAAIPERFRPVEVTPAPVRLNQSVDGLNRLQGKILNALAEFEAIGRPKVPRVVLAARCGCSHKGGYFGNTLGSLRTGNLVEYGSAKTVLLTNEGRSKASAGDAPMTTEAMLASCSALIRGKLGRSILLAVHSVYPKSLGREDLAATVGASAGGGYFGNTLGALRSFGMVEYLPEKQIKCAEWLFLD